jgi:transcriptional regulator with XRE-family HTH domain
MPEPLKTQIQAKYSLCQFAKIIGVNKGDVSRFLNGDKKHIGRPAKKKIKAALISLGFLPAPKVREYVVCSLGYKHIKKRELK